MVLKIRARAPPVHNSSALDCREWNPCELDATVPAWEQWYYILVERYLTNSDVYFRIGVQVTGEAFTGIPSVFVTVCLHSGFVLVEISTPTRFYRVRLCVKRSKPPLMPADVCLEEIQLWTCVFGPKQSCNVDTQLPPFLKV